LRTTSEGRNVIDYSSEKTFRGEFVFHASNFNKYVFSKSAVPAGIVNILGVFVGSIMLVMSIV